MKRTIGITLAAAALSGTAALADGIGLGFKAGTLGLGVEASLPLGESLALRGGYNGFDYDYDTTESDIRYDGTLELGSGAILLDWFPGGGNFRVSAGALINGNELAVKAKPESGATVNINGVDYDVTDIGSLDGNIDFEDLAPYVGVGWSNAPRKGTGWGFTLELGAAYQGSPKVSLEVAECNPPALAPPSFCADLAADVAAEERQLRHDLSDFEWYPVASLGVMFVF